MLPSNGHIIICEDPITRAEMLKEELAPKRVVLFSQEKFLVDDAKRVIEEAYISEADAKYLILAAKEYNIYSQNALLKILEEPPKNILFYLLAPSKSSLLPTIRSRMPVVLESKKKELPSIDIDLKKLDLTQVFSFLSNYKHLSKNEAKDVVEGLYKQAIHQGIHLDEKILENFDMAYRLLELNGRPQHILSMLLMGFLHENTTA